MNRITVTFLLICTILISACKKTNDEAIDPQGTITLNMYDESNGKTMLGNSDVYINNSHNFICSSSVISSHGTKVGLGANVPLDLSNLVNEISVKEGYLYSVFDKNSLVTFPSNENALLCNAAYYKMFVTYIFTEESKPVGAEVKYVLEYPNANGLPEIGRAHV